MSDKIYRDSDFTPEFNATVETAKSMWKESCAANYAKDGDYGSCVAGAGIYVMYLPKRCRKPVKHMIIHAHDVSACQGSPNWENGRQPVIDFLKSKGIEVSYDWGWMD